ncbi:hypothetical protein GOBAR_AA38767 [Gossypium barbadense]|uniref:Uncharacterized protein n=1 Tax=Gossypium barbadense TaxID=3634 RepID=A0A2P5VSX7_GOSBA|nr:hypothetical protein GOBAR_AA38767 [Gossypium barbadense]
MNGAKKLAEAVGCKNVSVGERSILGGSTRVSGSRRSESENVGLSNANIGENPMPRKTMGSSTRFIHRGVGKGRKYAPSQCSSTRHYDVEVTHAIFLGKAQTTFNKRVPVPETYTGGNVKEVGDLMIGKLVTKALVNDDHNYNGPTITITVKGKEGLFLGGLEPSVRYHSGRARILTLCQDLSTKGQSQVDSFYGARPPKRDWPSSAKAEGSLPARPTRQAGTKVSLSDPTIPSGKAFAQRIEVTLGITC